MSAASIYQEAKTWQGAISSLLGFAALLCGALFNFHLNRKRDAALRVDEAKTVAAALYSEILALRREAAQLAQATAREYNGWGIRNLPEKPFGKHFLEGNKLSEPALFKALANKVGLLQPKLAQAIIQFHLNIQEACQWAPLLSQDPERPFTYHPSYVLSPALAAVNDIVPALRQIEDMLALSPHEDRFDLIRAEQIMDDERSDVE